jgi:DNA-binding SARP family transcriptional activator
MIVLRVLGSLDLRGPDGGELRTVLNQPKRAALLAYLAAERTSAFHRRDTLLKLFWPESDEAGARDALNSALRFLRRALGPDVLVSRGDEEVGVNTQEIWTDLVAFEDKLAGGCAEGALDLYVGDLLTGFHVRDAGGFEDWLELKRQRLNAAAIEAARHLALAAIEAGNSALGVRWFRKALCIEPHDERALRGLIELVGGAGDRAEALRIYEDFAGLLERDLGLRPSPETQAVAAVIRARTAPGSNRPAAPPATVESTQPHVLETVPALAEAAPPIGPHHRPDHEAKPGRIRRHWRSLIGSGILLATIVGLLTSGERGPTAAPAYTILADVDGSAPPEVRRAVKGLLWLALDRDNVLRPVSPVELRPGLARMLRADSLPLDHETARELSYRGALRTAVAPSLDALGRTYVLTVRVVDSETGSALATERTEAQTEDGLIAAADRAIRALQRRLGARRRDLEATRPLVEATTASFEAYRKLVFEGPEAVRVERLREALALDTGFTAAWAALANYWSNVGGRDSMLAAIGHLERNLGRESNREQLVYRVTIATARRDYPGALALVDRLLSEYEQRPEWLNRRGRLLSLMGRSEEAIQATRQAIAASRFGPSRRHVVDLRQWLIIAGRPAEARHAEDSLRAVACRPNCPSWPDGRIEHLQFAILLDEWEKADSMLAISPHPLAAASLHARRGALRTAERAVDADGPGSGLHPELARLMLILMRPPPWRAPSALAAHDQLHALAWKGIWEALAGDTSLALRLAAAVIDSVPGPYRGAAPELARALVALRGGRWREVIDVLGPVAMAPEKGGGQNDVWVSPLPLRWLAARAYEELGLPDSAAAMYERVLIPGGSFLQPLSLRGIPYSFAHQRLVVLYAKLGRTDDARRHWDTFRRSFTNPDPEFRYLIDEADSALGRRSFGLAAPTWRSSPTGPLRF